jgi:hypothetical protein
MSSETYLTLQAENKLLKATQTQPKKRQGGKGKSKNKKQKKDRNNKDTKTAPKVQKYCHAHGTQHTHTSSECKLMAADAARFTPAMRRATGPNNPPGGSIKVMGQDPN